MKRFLVMLGLASAASFGAAELSMVDAAAKPAALVILYKPVPLNKDNPRQKRIGELIYRGGLELASPNKDFGGISGMRLWDKNIVLAVSDAGAWISFRLIEKNEKLVGVQGIALAPILDSDGKPGIKADRDAEALEIWASAIPGIALPAEAAGKKSVSVRFEGAHQRWIYGSVTPEVPKSFASPPVFLSGETEMAAWPKNGGAEAECQTGAQNMLALSEEAAGLLPNSLDGLFWHGNAIRRISFQRLGDFRPTDCVSTAPETGGDILLLQRRFSPAQGVAASIGVIKTVAQNSAEIVVAREIARLEPPLTVDNMEGIFQVRRNGRTFIYIMSDNNFSGLQRTLLMKFEWLPPVP